jgi:uncharacterized protein
MTSETFERLLKTTQNIIEAGNYDQAIFRLSGGEPLLVWKNYANLVTEYKQKLGGKMVFGLLSNLTILNDEILEWMKQNDIGIQVSLDDLHNSKPLKNGVSSSSIVLKNIEQLEKANICYSINSVFDYEKSGTNGLKELVKYILTKKIRQ